MKLLLMHTPVHRPFSTLLPLVLLCAAGLALSGCGGSGGSQEITETRTVTNPPSAAAPMGAQPASMAMAPAQASFAWEAPAGWTEQPATATRIANFKVDADTDAECYLTVLPGTGGGVEANINRWRSQLSLEPYTPAEMAELPTLKVLEKDALYVGFEGTFTGMGGGEKKEGYKLLGVIFEDGGSAVFVKMTGPAAVVDREKANFEAFCASLKKTAAAQVASNLPDGHPPLGPAAGSDLPAGHPEIGGATAPGMDPSAALPQGHPDISGVAPGALGDRKDDSQITQWTAPASWTQASEKPMRLVTYTAGPEGKAECYVTSLSGPAGGVDANINRWREQMGQTPLDAAALEALPKITILGKPSPMIEIEGSFAGMDGQGGEGFMLLGAVCPLEGETLFVKMTGPAAIVKQEKDNFVAFSESLK